MLPNRLRWLLLTTVLGVLLAAAGGCGSDYPPPGGDPGNRMLRELAADPVFAAVPPGASLQPRQDHPATFVDNGPLGGAGWDGAYVTVTGTGTLTVRALFSFYATRAQAAGWTPTATGAWHVTQLWTKTFPDGASAQLRVDPRADPRLPSPVPLTWTITGSVGKGKKS